MPCPLEKLRNIGIIAHIDAGKTTVTERMLYVSGAKHRAGEVDKGTTTTDDDVEEAERGITIYSAAVTFGWKDVEINLIDTPGHVDFTAEVERSLRVLDGGVVVFSAREGVEAQSETVWRQANKYHVPRLAFINKMDREGANFESTFQRIKERLDGNPVALQIPVGQGPAHVGDPFSGVIDLVRMKMLTFPGGKEGRQVLPKAIPELLLDSAAAWRERLLETLYDFSNELMGLALAEEPIPEELLHQVLRDATVHRLIQPVLCGSALHGMGVQPLLDAVAAYLPSPLDIPPVQGHDLSKATGRKKSAIQAVAEAPIGTRKPSPSEPFCGLVFKVLPYRTGDMAWVRIYSGTLKQNTRVLNPGKKTRENVAQLWRIHATKKEEQLQSATVGHIVGVIGLRTSITGDTLCDTHAPILLESIQFPDTVLSMAIEPETTAERDKLNSVLDMLRKQDPTFLAVQSEETGQTLISGMGELHLEVIKHKLLRDYHLKVKVHNPRVSYRETVERAVEMTGKCHRQIAGQQLSAEVQIRLEPFESPANQTVGSKALGTELAGEFLQVVLETLQDSISGSGLLGFPLLHVKATVLGAKIHATETNDVALRMATADAFDRALREAGMVLLEPMMRLVITTPEATLGDIVGDLQQRRAVIHQTENRGPDIVIHAEAPLASLFGYANAMRSLSQGRASCTMEPSCYSAAPPEEMARFV
ncbi:MAG: elongation factor G [Pirellulales bacterium]|nr:elongation factor G [Pirellulales bacterium]